MGVKGCFLMKVLMRDSFLPGNQYALELCKALSKYVDIVLLCKSDAGEIENEVSCKKIIFSKGVNRLDSAWKYLVSLKKEMNELRKGNYDIYHIQTYKNLFLEIPLFYYAKKYCRYVVTTVHNVLPHEVSRTDKRLHALWYGLSDLLIVHNEATEKSFVIQFPKYKDKIRIIPHGTYTSGIAQTTSKNNNNEKKEFLLFGQIRPYKGIDVLIDAVALLSRDIRKKIHIVIVGSQHPKQDTTDYKKLIELADIQDCVDFQKRRVPDEELPDLFEKADFALFPYKEIYGSGALLMAYTYDKPVIVSDIPAFVEETDNGSTGLLFQTENPKDLAKCIEKAVEMSSTEIENCKLSIKKLVDRKYNWNISAKKLFDIYASMYR